MTFEDFCKHKISVAAHLAPPHVLALRLYSTAAFASLNTPFRKAMGHAHEQRDAHPFPITMNFIREGIARLRAIEAMEGDYGTVDLYRFL